MTVLLTLVLLQGTNNPRVKTPKIGPPNVPLIFSINERIVSTEIEAKKARPVAIAPITRANANTQVNE